MPTSEPLDRLVSPERGRPPLPAARARPVFIGSDIYRRRAFSGNHPLNVIRHPAVFDLVQALGWLAPGDFHSSDAASVDQLLAFHDRDYVLAVRDADASGRVARAVRERYHIGTFENPLFPGLFERAAMTVGGSIAAARLACEDHVAFHPSGGTHHGRPDRASGFCYFNDPVFAMLTFLANGCRRVLYVDLDAHHGDGVQDAFVDETRVMTVSIHEDGRWPFTGAVDDRGHGGARNLPVPAGLNDSELRYLMDRAVLPIAEAFDPDALVLCCGADSLAGDPLSGMMLSNVALWDAVDRLIDLGAPTVVLGGGGYNPWTLSRYWAGLWGRIGRHRIPDTLPPAALPLLEGMECDLIEDEDIDRNWMTSLADSPNEGTVRDEIKSLAATVRR